MLLYHGTSETKLNKILKNRTIKPRGNKGKGNWEHTIVSAPDRVYLTDAYAGYFAANVAKDNERWAIIEVDTDYLNENNFRPDEDCIAQLAYNDPNFNEVWGDKPVKEYQLLELTQFVRENIHLWTDKWRETLHVMGTCSYKGNIPTTAIIRYALFDTNTNTQMALAACDPSITPMNYKFKGATYKAITKWLMGEKITLEEYEPMMNEIEKSGLAIDHLNNWKKHIENMLSNQHVEIHDFSHN